MNILLISNAYPTKKQPYSGIFIQRRTQNLERLDVRSSLCTPGNGSLFDYSAFFMRILFHLVFGRYDLIHAYYGFHSALIPAMFNPRRKPLIVNFQGSDVSYEPYRNKLYFFLQKFVTSRADYIISTSRELNESLVSKFAANPHKISHIVTSGVDTKMFTPKDKQACRAKLGVPIDRNIIIFVGNLTFEKGISLVYECAEKMSDALFISLGHGSINVKKEIANCLIVGPKPPHTIPFWINAADICFLPSLSEGTPNVIMEALSCGIPVVASNVGGIPDLVKDGKTGYLVESEDVNMFESKLRELLANPEKRKQMGQQGREDMIENYDSRKIAERVKRVYEKALSKSRPAPF